MTGKTFDNGLLCSSPNSVVVDEAIAEEARAVQALGAYFMNERRTTRSRRSSSPRSGSRIRARRQAAA
jgi:acetaldehyde dehydrogenase (acetylating)